MKKQWILLPIALCLTAASAPAAEELKAPTPPPAALVSADNPGSFDPAAATQAWLDTVPANERAQSAAYFEGGYWLILWNYLVGAAIAIFLLESRVSARLRDWAERITRFRTAQVALYAIPFTLITAALGFPLSLYQDFFREHAYGFATQNFAPWFGEQMIGLIVVLVSWSVFLPMLYAVFRRAPRTWWMWGTGLAVAFVPVLFIIEPLLIEPLFNTYKPLTDPVIKGPILAMARANEIPAQQVFEFDASRQTTKISANVSGFLGTTRIALNDNLLKRCSLPEIRMVMAHEMGHYVLNHMMKLIFETAAVIFVAFAVARGVFDAAVRRSGNRWGIRGIGDLAGLPLLMLIMATVAFLGTPVANTISRVTEREADAFGLNTSRESDGMATVALKLSAYRKLNPGPAEEFIFYDHPSGRARIRMAMDWKAAQLPAGDVSGNKSRE